MKSRAVRILEQATRPPLVDHVALFERVYAEGTVEDLETFRELLAGLEASELVAVLSDGVVAPTAFGRAFLIRRAARAHDLELLERRPRFGLWGLSLGVLFFALLVLLGWLLERAAH